MTPDYWQKQTKESPLFPDILWSRPENRMTAGKLLIIGGNAHGFAAPAEAYQHAVAVGIGTAKVILPDALQKTVGRILENGEFAPSTPSGSFAKSALAELLDLAAWSDGVLLAGDLGRNSETAIMLEQFTNKYQGPLVITKDAVEYFTPSPKVIAKRPLTTFVLSLSQLQRLSIGLHYDRPFLLSMGLMLLTQNLHDFTLKHGLTIVTKELETIVVANNGKISTTKTDDHQEDLWRVKTAAQAAVFWIQNQAKPYEAITTALAADGAHHPLGQNAPIRL